MAGLWGRSCFWTGRVRVGGTDVAGVGGGVVFKGEIAMLTPTTRELDGIGGMIGHVQTKMIQQTEHTSLKHHTEHVATPKEEKKKKKEHHNRSKRK